MNGLFWQTERTARDYRTARTSIVIAYPAPVALEEPANSAASSLRLCCMRLSCSTRNYIEPEKVCL